MYSCILGGILWCTVVTGYTRGVCPARGCQAKESDPVNYKVHKINRKKKNLVFSICYDILGPNTNVNTIRVQILGRIRIRTLFGFRNLAEYEYEYNSGTEIWPNTNIIWSTTFVQIRIRILRLFEKYRIQIGIMNRKT